MGFFHSLLFLYLDERKIKKKNLYDVMFFFNQKKIFLPIT